MRVSAEHHAVRAGVRDVVEPDTPPDVDDVAPRVRDEADGSAP